MTSHGTVRSWDFDEGHGVIDSVDTPGGCHASTSEVLVEGVVLATGDHLSRIGLAVGESVDFEFAADEYDDTEFVHHAVGVWPSRCPAPTRIPRGAFQTALWFIGNGDDGVRIARQADPADLPPAPPRDPLPRTTGTVRSWNCDEGWGVIDSADTPGARGHSSVRFAESPATGPWRWVHLSNSRGRPPTRMVSATAPTTSTLSCESPAG